MPAAVVSPSALPGRLSSGLELKHLPSLDGIRAIAAFLVIFYHAGVPFIPGGTGVLLFFVLSGFLITWLLLLEDDRNGTISLGKFYARRTLRIFPAFYFYFIVVIGLAVLTGRTVHWPQAIASLLYVQDYYQALHGDPSTGLSHTWSLSVEEQFYLLWPAIFLALRRNRHNMARCLLAVAGAVPVYRLILIFGFHVNQGYLYEAFDSRADSLTVGCLLAVALREHIGVPLFRAVCGAPWQILITLGLFVASTAAENRWGPAYRDPAGYSVNNVLAALLLVQVIAFRESALAGWLNWSWVRYLGRISYSLYLWQQFAIPVAEKALGRFGLVPRFAGTITAVIFAASASYFFIERPILRFKERFQIVRHG